MGNPFIPPPGFSSPPPAAARTDEVAGTAQVPGPASAAPPAKTAKVVPPQIEVPAFSYEAKVDPARGDPNKSADVLHDLAHDVKSGLITSDDARVALTNRLLDGLSPDQMNALRTSYVLKFKVDPELDILGHDMGGPLRQLFDGVVTHDVSVAKPDLGGLRALTPGELAREATERAADQAGRTVTGSGISPRAEEAMAAAVARPELAAKAKALGALLNKPDPLSQEDRAQYFSTLPTIGLWNHSRRSPAGDDSLDAPERTLMKEEWAKVSSVPFDDAMARLESRMPPAPGLTQPPERSVAIIASSGGAQLQELFDEAKPLLEKGYAVQIFTPDGRPVSLQRDSTLVLDRTFPTGGEMGYGSPLRLNPREKTNSALLSQALGTTTSAENFDPKKFGAVYLAGGLGFNEDVAVATVQNGHTTLTANPHIADMMHRATDANLPIIGLCHGGTLLAAVNGSDGRPLAAGVETSSLPAASEIYAIASGRAAYPFRYVGDHAQFPGIVDTHSLLAQAGAKVDAFRDVGRLVGLRPLFGDISRSSRTDQKTGKTETFTFGEGPQAGPYLAAETLKILAAEAPTR